MSDDLRQAAVEILWGIESLRKKLELFCKLAEQQKGASVKLPSKPVAPKQLSLPTEITDPQALLDEVPDDINMLSRVQLVDKCHEYGYQESDTRGKPVKTLREMLTTKMTVEEEPVKAPPTRPLVKLNRPTAKVTFKLPSKTLKR